MKTSDIASERLVIGILAHVDAGKTTLSESLLYLSGSIRKMGRVDKRDTFLDTDETERARGITIYAKQAVFSSPERDRIYTILDTPGHADFSAEMERTLSVLDAAVLLISAADGINAQVRLLWSLLAHHSIPVLIFINKMDQAAAIGEEEHRRQELLSELQQTLSENILDFSDGSTDPGLQEALALSSNDETLLEQVMAGETINDDTIRSMVTRRECFPAVFGSALKMQHTDTLLHLLDTCVQMPASLQTAPSQNEGESLLPQDTYGARVIKISHTPSGERETWLKITNGRLTVRQPVTYPVLFSEDPASDTAADPVDSAFTEEKITQIRLYSGEKYIPLQEALPGTVCTVTGLTGTYAGQGLGTEADASKSLLAPVLAWQILLPPEVDPVQGYRQLKLLEEEDPMLQLHYDERRKEIRAHLMGEVQREILTGQARKRFGWEIRFGLPSVIYKETISAPIEGVGHFEPLRHYAEVHLLLEPGEPGSGLTYEDRCPPDTLPGQYRRQILSELAKRRHRGVLTGSEITDMHISLIGGRAHEKHTCGGDFRQAAWRAVRQGLMMAQNVLLEPFYSFTMLLPSASLGRALTDLQQMNASFQAPEPFSDRGGTSISRITGLAPVASMDAYRETFSAYTRGEGHLELQPGPYRPCADAETVIEDIAYDPDADRGQPSDSVFCMHGAGTRIPWDQVRSYMHVTGCADPYIGIQTDGRFISQAAYAGTDFERPAEHPISSDSSSRRQSSDFKLQQEKHLAAENELMAIFEKTYGPIRRHLPAEDAVGSLKSAPAAPKPVYRKPRPKSDQAYLLVDGYNIIHAWEDLRELAEQDLQAARESLLDILSDYAGYDSRSLICVFDAYKVAGGQERVYHRQNIDVVFTKEAETADQYIEKTAHALSGKYDVFVATSDGLEQIIIFGSGAHRISARELLEDILLSRKTGLELLKEQNRLQSSRVSERLADKLSTLQKQDQDEQGT